MKKLALGLGLAALCAAGAGVWYLQAKPATPPAEADPIMVGLLGSPQQVDPMSWGLVANQLFAQGDRLRAAFTFYVFQVRTLPYIQAYAGTERGNVLTASRNGLNQMVGAQINEWIATDPEAVYQLARQAIAYEATLSHDNLRPQEMPAEEWNRIVAQERAAYAASLENDLGSPDQRRALIELRRNAGFTVGPLKDPGKPLPPEWVHPAAK